MFGADVAASFGIVRKICAGFILFRVENVDSKAPGRTCINIVGDKIETTLPEYHQIRGWEAAFPTNESLKRPGLDECVDK